MSPQCRADGDEAPHKVFGSAARMLCSLAASQPTALEAALSDAYPWVKFLPPDECEMFVLELAEQLLAVDSIDDFSPVDLLVGAWKATAEVHADPGLARRLAGPFEATHGGRVPRPTL